MNLEELDNLLTEELSWRRSEINRLQQAAESSLVEGEDRIHAALNKSLTLLIYSHWEGFIKKIALIYLQYVSDQTCLINDLSMNFKILSLRKSIKKLSNATPKDESKTIKMTSVLTYLDEYNAVISGNFFVKTHYDDPEKYKNNQLINTESNLNAGVFSTILENLGMNLHPYYLEILDPPFRSYLQSEDDKSLIAQIVDQTLLKCRNHNAHGRENSAHAVLEFEILKHLKQIILVMMQQFKDDVSEFASNEYYLQSKQSEKSIYEVQANTDLKTAISIILTQFKEMEAENQILESGVSAVP
ncbi:MAE_28990/MAE_18760 family HEPN-like nuclease [Acinetobacter dispersus]|uniref:MAE_28990/MAE_18760 family HEPN-like nuclease n=1 Tax=Acinetobacter dispersus TaxID=70348 RepID=UPI001F4B8CF6|nr:MAE_28990/MAE_18760 family HEPN-like nuclease [Acinetobacter dispersus]MCH7390893.1 MAE_28990/MAE_18760 family HEPN-like nuclease [Acinetobacter dispersus]